jgi:hypothetical protein
MEKPSLETDYRDEKTIVYVAGQGAEEDRVFLPVTSSRRSASPYNWREVTISANESETTNQLTSAGNSELSKRRPKINFDFDAIFDALDYNVDYELGDRFTAVYGSYIENHRIVEIKIKLTDDESIEIKTQKFPNVELES